MQITVCLANNSIPGDNAMNDGFDINFWILFACSVLVF
jgi:hypothetical protein